MKQEFSDIRRQLQTHLRYLSEIGVEAITPIDWASVREAETEQRASSTPAREVTNIEAVSNAQLKPVFQSARVAEQNLLFGDLMPPSSPTTPLGRPGETLADIRTDLGDCQRCKLCHHRTHIVFGEGNLKAKLVFVGEAPGADEDASGRPFVGRAGQLLTKIIESIGLQREDCYICNILKCRPPGNRDPEKDEVAACESFLFRQIAAIKPKLIVALGTHGAQTLLRTKEPISKLRGRFHEYRGTKLLATFHPAYLLRDPNRKKDTWEDMKKVRDFLAGEMRGSELRQRKS